MTISFFKYTNSERNVTKSLEGYGEFTGTLKADTSILNPTFSIGDGSFYQLLGTVNYLHVPMFGNRWYFIKDIRIIRNDLFFISCHVDVLHTYRDKIRKHGGIISRQANKWNLYLNDNQFRAYQDCAFSSIEFPQGFSGQGFVLVTMGGNPST